MIWDQNTSLILTHIPYYLICILLILEVRRLRSRIAKLRKSIKFGEA